MRPQLVILLVSPITLGGLAFASATMRAASQPRIALTLSPSAQTAVRGGAVSFSVDVRRSSDRRAAVQLTVARLPTGVRASWRLPSGAVASRRATTEQGAVLKLQVRTRAPLGTRRVIVRATGQGRTVRRSLRLTVVRRTRRGFAIRVHPARQVPASFPLRVRTLRLQVRAKTTKPGCRGDRDYTVSQYGGGYPLVLPPGRSRLRALVPDASLWRIAMRDLPRNQDACKGAVVRFDDSGLATR